MPLAMACWQLCHTITCWQDTSQLLSWIFLWVPTRVRLIFFIWYFKDSMKLLPLIFKNLSKLTFLVKHCLSFLSRTTFLKVLLYSPRHFIWCFPVVLGLVSECLKSSLSKDTSVIYFCNKRYFCLQWVSTLMRHETQWPPQRFFFLCSW